MTVKSTAGTVTLPKNTYAMPIINRQVQTDLIMKVGTGPNTDKSWSVTVAGISVSAVSNIGGIRHNIPINTPLVFDPPVDGIASAVTSAAWVGGADPTGQEALHSAVLYEHMAGTLSDLVAKSAATAFPALVLAWAGSDPASGSSTSTLNKRGTMASAQTLIQDSFLASLFVSRLESDAMRRSDGLALIDRISSLWTDRRSVDEQVFSGPAGTMIQRRMRVANLGEAYQRFHCYQLAVALTRTLQREDTRTYNEFDHALINGISPQVPVLPGQGDLTVVDDLLVNL